MSMGRRGLAAVQAALVAMLVAMLLTGCGGGGTSGGGEGAPPAGSGALSLSLAGGAHTGVDHVWVTVTAVALHTDAAQPWSPADPSWQRVALAQPTAIDLASLTNGVIASLFAGKALPPGTYAQLRLFVLGHDEPLAASAADHHLLYNAQVDTTDAGGSTHTLPLELGATTLGLRAQGPVTVSAGALTSITLLWDLDRSLVRFAGDGSANPERFTLRPDLRALDLAGTGAIVGLLDKSLLCTAGQTSGCIDEVVVSAQLPSADGSMSVSVRSTPLVMGDTYALFALYPLPVSPNGLFDVVIRGRRMQTLLVRDVPASAADLLAAAPTQLGANPADPEHPAPMVPVLSAQGDALASLAQPLATHSAQVVFSQTPPGAGALPHEIVAANTDPFTGLLVQPARLPSGPLRVATYSATTALAFTDSVAQEGADSFTARAFGTRYDDPGPAGVLSAPGGTTVAVAVADPVRMATLGSGTLTVDLATSTPGAFDGAELVVSDVAGIVATQDVSALIGQAGARTTLALPAGSEAAALGGTAVYTVAVRAWRRAAPDTSLQWVRVRAPVDLRSSSAASVALTLP
ncbi:MAG: DUF4382 domain-containing protein [Rhizobacter sp.]|nr:DUF4382 domain-containing protein [Rhizobacter sp.]